MKKKGFTLIELIVVIAIIGVLAAILVPAMLGYVSKSKIMSANTAAKQIHNAMNTAMVEMEQYDFPVQMIAGDVTTTGAAIYACKDTPMPAAPTHDATTLEAILYSKVSAYFSDVRKINDITYVLEGYGCTGVGVIKGQYPGTSPMAITIEDYRRYLEINNSLWDAQDACDFAMGDLDLS